MKRWCLLKDDKEQADEEEVYREISGYLSAAAADDSCFTKPAGNRGHKKTAAAILYEEELILCVV